MIEHLYIKNAALIEEVSVDFNRGLNILSGETGAGKSIIIDSIGFVFGGRQNKDFIRHGESSASVEALIYIENEKSKKEIEEMGIEVDEDNSLLISRIIMLSGKNICRINGKNVTVGMLKSIAAIVINIHSQHEHQSLLNQSKHIGILDKFCDEKLECCKKQIAEKMRKLKEISKQLSAYAIDDDEKKYKLDLYKFQIDEITAAELYDGEEEELREKLVKLEDNQKICKLGNTALEFLYRSEEMSASDRISGALNTLFDLYNIDGDVKVIYDKLEKLSMTLDDVIIDLRNYTDGISSDEYELQNLKDRLKTILSLEKKYGSSIADIIDFLEKTQEKYDFIINSGEMSEKLEKEKSDISKEILSICAEMTQIRKNTAQKIKHDVEKSLHELGMEDAVFDISIESKDTVSINGNDRVEFMICANKGEEMKPLSKTASGGEMSRVMLSLKSVLSRAETAETFIFDEIDSGVSGRTAHQVAIKLAELSLTRQIMCITHLPQIAAMADGHFLIEKKTENGRTSTNITELKDDGITNELSRLTGGAKIKQSTLEASRDMKKLADGIKEELKKEL